MDSGTPLPKNGRDLFDLEKRQKIILMPGRILSTVEEASEAERTLTLIKFPHPGNGHTCMWAFNADVGHIHQIFSFDEACRSWFVGNYVLEDGSLYCMVPVDPLFLVIPFLLHSKKKKVFQLLHDILSGITLPRECHRAQELLMGNEGTFLRDLDLICNIKDFRDTKFMKLSKSKLVRWLKVKVANLSQALCDENINVSWKVSVAGYNGNNVEVSRSKEELDEYAMGIIGDYLPADLRLEMTKSLGLAEAKGSPSTVTTDLDRKRKVSEICDTNEDYTKDFKMSLSAPEKKLTAAQKSLQKVDKTGMKSLSSYFTRAKNIDKKDV